MKKIILSIAVVILFNLSFDASACTNFIVTKGASKDGSTFVSYSADAGGFMEPLFFLPRAKYAAGTMLDVYDWDSGKYLGKIKQAAETYQVIGNMNEYQVAIGETTFGGVERLHHDTTAIVDYGSLMRLALQRAKTAREAIKVMTDLVKEYGYHSEGESFSITDGNEAWMLEMIGKGGIEKGAVWVAVRIPDGYVAAHANQARIRQFPMNDPENCLYAPDVITFAEKNGFYNSSKDGKFSFADVYNPLEPGGLLFCEGRVWSLFNHSAPSLKLRAEYWQAYKGEEPYPLYIKPDNKLSVRDVMNFMRDHFEGTPYDMTKEPAAEPFGSPLRWKPLAFKIEGDTNSYGWGRPISTQQTAFSFVAQSRTFLPREIGGIFWYGVDDTYSTVYVPLYANMKSTPACFTGGSISELDLNSAFWIFNLVSNLAYTKYSYIIKDVQEVQKRLEDKYELYQPIMENAAMVLYKNNPQVAVDFLTDYSLNESQRMFEEWTKLWKNLVVKYNDGYINNVNDQNGRSPKGVGYSDKFLKGCVNERPGYYDVKMKTKAK